MTLSLYVKISKHLCIFYIFKWIFFYITLTFFNIYSHWGRTSVFTNTLRWGFSEAEPDIMILMQVIYQGSVSKETCKDMKDKRGWGWSEAKMWFQLKSSPSLVPYRALEWVTSEKLSDLEAKGQNGQQCPLVTGTHGSSWVGTQASQRGFFFFLDI